MTRDPSPGSRSAPVLALARPDPAPKKNRARRIRAFLLIAVALILLVSSSWGAVPQRSAAGTLSAQYTETPSIYVRVVRTGWTTAAVLGVQNGTSSGVSVSILVQGVVTNSTSTIYNGEFWSLTVPVANGSAVQAAIGSSISYPVNVPTYASQPVAPRGIIYAHGSQLMLNGTPIQLFGGDEETAFTYAMLASGLSPTSNPSQYWGNNQLFPSGPDTKIANVSSVDQLWQRFFQYFLHYNQVAGSPSNPKVNVIRITIVDDSFIPDGAYNAWQTNPTGFWQLFDSMLYWAGRAGIYVVPVLGHLANGPSITPDEDYYNVSSVKFAHQVALVSAILARYNNDSRIAMWDLWNEPDVWNNNYWSSVGGISGFRNWASTYIADVKPYSSNHLINMGIGGFTLFPGAPGFGWEYYFFFNDIPGLDVGSNHYYATAQDQYLIDWPTAWHIGLNKPNFEGEFGYNAPNNALGYGYWPWYAQQTRASGWPAIASMVFLDDGKGPYADYPYTGMLPSWPPGNGSAGPGPVASFSYSPSSPAAGQPISFDASSSSDAAPITSYAWNFGDQTTGTGVTVGHTYSTAGTYTVSLQITDSNAGTNTTTNLVPVSSSSGGSPSVPPSVTTAAASSVGASTAVLNGQLAGLGSASSVTVGFRYGTDSTLAGAVNVTAGSLGSPASFSQAVSGLVGSTTYYYDSWALGSGFSSGSVASFRTGTGLPTVATYAATSKGQTTATLNGYLGSLGSHPTVNVGFLYSSSLSLAGAINVSAGVLNAAGAFKAAVNGLATGTTYYFRAWANGTGFASGEVLNFTAANWGLSAPHANTKKGKGTSATTALLSGNVTSLGSANVVNVGFLYGTSPSLSGAFNVTTGILSSPGDFSVTAGGLSPGLTYYFEAWADGQGFAWGGILNVTVPWSVPPAAPTVLGVTYMPEAQTLDVLFSEAMNESSVTSALSLTPSSDYDTLWLNTSHLQIQFISGLPPNQQYSLTIAPSASSMTGLSLQDAFTFRFVVPAAATPSADTGWAAWLPAATVGLAAGWAVALVLLVRSRRKLKRLRASAKRLARRIQELNSLNGTPATTGRAAAGPVRRAIR